MTIPNITIEQLLEAGVHLGHKTLRWNPKMKKYIFGRRDTIHIIDLTQTVELIKASFGQRFTKLFQTEVKYYLFQQKNKQQIILLLANDTDQFYVNHRWLGGMLTNWGTISNSIKKLEDLNKNLTSENRGFTKKELIENGYSKR